MQQDMDLCFNGVDASTGRYLLEPCKADEFSALTNPRIASSMLPDLVDSHRRRQEGLMRLPPWVDESSLAQSGWGVIFPKSLDPAIREALMPLMEWRKRQAGEHYFELTYEAPETELSFLAGHGKGPGPVDPKILPYYILLVGDPEQIPFDFQFQLAVDFAVGRLQLEAPEDYERYAKAVVRSEQQKPDAHRQAIFFGVSNPDDQATAVSQKHLVEPLAVDFEERAKSTNWKVERVFGDKATKQRLSNVLTRPSAAGSFLFTASHGVGFSKNSTWQQALQGAILCADWPGPRRWKGSIPPEFYFSARDLPDETTVEGAIIMAFACYSAGTPQTDSFYHREGRRSRIASSDFIARLPQRLLAQGALAFVGHIDRAWTFSFYWPEAKAQRAVFESAFVSLLLGRPIGAAMDYFGARHAKLATNLIEMESRLRRGNQLASPLSLAGLWTAYNDAKSYVILGDPATRLVNPGASR